MGSQVIKIRCTFKDVQGTPMLMYSVHYVCTCTCTYHFMLYMYATATLSSVTGVGSPVQVGERWFTWGSGGAQTSVGVRVGGRRGVMQCAHIIYFKKISEIDLGKCLIWRGMTLYYTCIMYHVFHWLAKTGSASLHQFWSWPMTRNQRFFFALKGQGMNRALNRSASFRLTQSLIRLCVFK